MENILKKHLSKSKSKKKEGCYQGWCIFEGRTSPDLYIKTDKTIIVAEAKRTERGRTKSTKWLKERDQLIRHMDDAYEQKNGKKLYALMIIDSVNNDVITSQWKKDLCDYRDKRIFQQSLPHRSKKEICEIANSYIGYVTWRALTEKFKINYSKLPDKK